MAPRLAVVLALLALVGAAAWCSRDDGRDDGSAGDGGGGQPGGAPGAAGSTGGGGGVGDRDAGGGCSPERIDGRFVVCCDGQPCRGSCDNGRCVCFDQMGTAIVGGCGEGSFCCIMTSVKGCLPVSEAERCRGGPP